MRAVPLPELCHYVGHANGIKSALTLQENVAFWVDFLGGGDADLDDALAMFGLAGTEGSAGWTAVGGTEAEACAPSPLRRAPPDLAARRALGLARCRVRQGARQGDRAASCARRHRRGREPYLAEGEIRARARARSGRPSSEGGLGAVPPRRRSCLARGRHHRHRARLLPRRRRHHAARPRPRPQSALAHRAWRLVGGAPARKPALRRPHLPQRL